MRLSKVPTDLQRQGIFNEFDTMSLLGQQLACQGGPGGVRSPNSCMAGGGTPVVLIPTSDPSSNPFNQKPAPGYDVSPFEQPLGRALVNAYPLANGSFQSGQFNRADSFLEFANRLDMKARVDWNVTNNTKAYVRIARESEDIENKRGVWWGASDVTLPSPNIGTNHGRSVSGNVVSVLSPTMTNEALVSWSQLKLDNAYDDPSKMTLAGQGLGNQLNGAFQSGSPSLPGVIPNWGGGIGNLWAAANDMYAHNDELTFSNKLTKIAGAHGLKFGASLQRLQKQQNFNANEEGYFVYAPDWTAYSTGNAVSDMLTGVITQYVQGSNQPKGEFRMWNFDVFAQDSWKIRPNFTLEYGVRGGYWTNNRSLVEGQGAFLDPALYDPAVTVPWLDPGTYSRLNGYCYTATGCAPDSIMPTRDPFVMPRVNAAWDIDGQGNNVVRGGYGLFFNRNMGNVEYDSFLRFRRSTPSSPMIRGRQTVTKTRLVGGRSELRHLAANFLGQDQQHQSADVDSGFVDIPEDAQLQRVLRAADSVEPGPRGGLCRHARARPRQPDQPERRASRSVVHRDDRKRECGQRPDCTLLALRRSHQLDPSVPCVRQNHAVRLRGRVELQLDAAHAQPPDGQAAAVLRVVHAGPEQRHTGRRVS